MLLIKLLVVLRDLLLLLLGHVRGLVANGHAEVGDLGLGGRVRGRVEGVAAAGSAFDTLAVVDCVGNRLCGEHARLVDAATGRGEERGAQGRRSDCGKHGSGDERSLAVWVVIWT